MEPMTFEEWFKWMKAPGKARDAEIAALREKLIAANKEIERLKTVDRLNRTLSQHILELASASVIVTDALKAVEWINHGGNWLCPWCFRTNLIGDGHAKYCKRQLALSPKVVGPKIEEPKAERE
jgi:hypothetical protein